MTDPYQRCLSDLRDALNEIHKVLDDGEERTSVLNALVLSYAHASVTNRVAQMQAIPLTLSVALLRIIELEDLAQPIRTAVAGLAKDPTDLTVLASLADVAELIQPSRKED